MVLSDEQVLVAMRQGCVVIEPFELSQLATSSYDVRLGEWFYREQSPKLAGNVFNPLSADHVARVWGDACLAPNADAHFNARECEEMGFDRADRVILLSPGETILAHTEEFIGGRATPEVCHPLAEYREGSGITTMMKARSSMGRCFITVCKCAGWGDVGYVNRWTMEITNVSQHYRIPLLVGARVAQIVFMETGPIRGEDYSARGAYQTMAELERVRAEWRPSMMLPKFRR